MEVPALRVPLKAISSWWLAGGRYVEARTQSQWFGGVMFPIGN